MHVCFLIYTDGSGGLQDYADTHTTLTVLDCELWRHIACHTGCPAACLWNAAQGADIVTCAVNTPSRLERLISAASAATL